MEDSDIQYTKQILKDLDLEDRESLNKSEFNQVFFKLITKDEDSENFEFYLKVVDKYSQTIPETIPTKLIAHYIDFNKLKDIVMDSIKEEYGQEYLDEIQQMFDDNKEEL